MQVGSAMPMRFSWLEFQIPPGSSARFFSLTLSMSNINLSCLTKPYW